MPRWRLLLGGPIIWAMHFGAIYAVTSTSHIVAGVTDLTARIVLCLVSAACLIACAWVGFVALRQPKSAGLEVFWRTIAVTGAVLAAIAIVWQTFPVFAPLEGTAQTHAS